MRALKFQQMSQGGISYQIFGGSASASASQTKSKYEDFKESEEYKKMTPHQQRQYDLILERGEAMLDQDVDTTGADAMKSALDSQMTAYQDILSGGADYTGLNQMLDMQRAHGEKNLGQMTAQIGQQANLGGGAGGSRGGIAQGMATSDANRMLTEQQNKTMFDFNQQQQQNKLRAAQGIGATADAYGKYQTVGDADLQRLMAMKDLFSGDMGMEQVGTGSETARGSAESKTKSASASGKFGGSDERLKKNIKNTGNKVRVNKTGAEIPEKSFEYTKEAQEDFGQPAGEQTGVMAKDVEKEDPSAVSTMTSKGKKKKKRKTVNYAKLNTLDKMWENI